MYAYMDVCVYVETEEHLQRVITAPNDKWRKMGLIYSLQTGASSVVLPEDVLQISCIPLPIFLPSAQTSHSRWPPLPELGSV